ncbi:hypothetical protein [Halopiger goleimassiliensis]|uniref:hypothetical protein n=1 Tax=Halopiger goleimassiliensis TaxID=1293048 RepID=UPI000677DC70|nr:hypothetical protein [Halopiger goleimassiliensis]
MSESGIIAALSNWQDGILFVFGCSVAGFLTMVVGSRALTLSAPGLLLAFFGGGVATFLLISLLLYGR